MSRKFYNLPPLTTLTAFEAAARHLSFKNAAAELNVTPGAVSHQIRALEGELGANLFHRRHRGVELTANGQKLFATLSDSFQRISDGLRSISKLGPDRSVTFGATSAVAALWLTPAVARFWRANGDIPVNQIVSDHGFTQFSYLDLLIRYGRDPNPTLQQTALFRDHLVPVAHQDFLDGTPMTLEQLAQQRLIHLISDHSNWTSWADWFAALGYDGPIAPGIRVNNYMIALQAAQDGSGIALGWQRLIRPLLQSGKLSMITPHVLTAPHRFHIVTAPEADLPEHVKTLRDWFLKDSAAQFT